MAKPSDIAWRAANRGGGVEKALRRAGERVAARATAINRAEGGTANYSLRFGYRRGGRAYVDVVSDNEAEERGTEEVRRINALRRASRGE